MLLTAHEVEGWLSFKSFDRSSAARSSCCKNEKQEKVELRSSLSNPSVMFGKIWWTIKFSIVLMSSTCHKQL